VNDLIIGSNKTCELLIKLNSGFRMYLDVSYKVALGRIVRIVMRRTNCTSCNKPLSKCCETISKRYPKEI